MLNGLIQSRNTTEEKRSIKSTPNKKMTIGIYILIITSNVNLLNAPTKRHRLAKWIHKQYPYICTCFHPPNQSISFGQCI